MMRSSVEAATVSTHGSMWLTWPWGLGTEVLVLPAEAATKVPAATALRKAVDVASVHGEVPPLIE